MGSRGLPWPSWLPLLYAYSADGEDGRHGVWGVTDEFHVAQRRLREALTALPPGTVGTIRLAVLDHALPRPEYRYGPVVARFHRDEKGIGEKRTGEWGIRTI